MRLSHSSEDVPPDGENVVALPAALSGSADSLAGDYAEVAREVLLRISALEATTSINTVSGR